MPKATLTEARVGALRSRKTTHDIRDGELKGFGVHVLPSGRKRFFVHCQRQGERVWKIVGDAETMSVSDARSCADALSVRALNEPEEWGPSDHCRIAMEFSLLDRPGSPEGRWDRLQRIRFGLNRIGRSECCSGIRRVGWYR